MKRKLDLLLCIASAVLAVSCSDGSGSLIEYTSPNTAWEAAAEKTDIPKSTETVTAAATTAVTKPSSLLSSEKDIDLRDTDGQDTNYLFTYNDEDFEAVYTPDNWHIADSYRITDTADITLICRALSDIHPIPNKERNGYRTAEDMAYEWNEHNRAYNMLSDDSEWKEHVRSVDLDPDDQGRSLMDMAMDRLN